MKWIVVSIVVFIAIYTFLTLYFRKPGQAYQPYHDNKERATISRLKSAGYRRITATADRPAELGATTSPNILSGPAATITDFVGGLSEELKGTLIDQPRLPATFDKVVAPSEINRLAPYSVRFVCGLPDNKQLLSGAYVYVKDDELAIVPDFEKIEGDLLSRTREAAVEVTIPAGVLPPGTYRATLVGARGSKQRTVQVH
jgi:hypothetical protein